MSKRSWLNPFIATFRRVADASRRELYNSDKDLESGPAPVGLARIIRSNNNGVTGSRMVRGWPETSDSLVRIPHQRVIRQAGSAVIAGKQSDDAMPVPAIYIGNN